MRLILVATGALCAAPLAFAQAPAPSPAPSASPQAAPTPPPEAPKPAPELQKLAFLVGDWIHAEEYPAGPEGPGGKGGGRSKTSWVLGDHHLYVIYASKTPMGTVEGRGFVGWDPEARTYRMDWFDNAGQVTRYVGDFAPDGALLLKATVHHGGKAIPEHLSIKRQDDGRVLFTLSLPGEGGTAPRTVMESMASPEKK
jgi:hypothetical protein